MNGDPFLCPLPADGCSRPAPGTETLTSLAGVTSAELAWDRNPRNPDRKARIARNFNGLIQHIQRYRRRQPV